MSWAELASKYADEGLVLGLGAGVSRDCGLPSWSELMHRIAEARPDSPPIDELRADGMGYPAIATLLRQEEPPMEFAQRVREALYRGFEFFPEGWKSRSEEFVEFVMRTNPTLRAIAALCAGPIDPSGQRMPNPRIHAVVTFNLDALLQEYIWARYGRKFVRTIERATAFPTLGKINLYHVHGHIRFDPKWQDRTKNAPDALVLGEHEYFDIFDNPTAIFTYSSLHLLREHSFLFIGLSMHDDNLRRLLYYSRREIWESYIAEGIVEPEPIKVNRHFAVLKTPKNPAVAAALEKSLCYLGVNVAWVNEYNEISSKLQELYESGGGNWENVW